MKRKLKVGVLMGGPSAEREISLITGKAVYQNLDRKKYQPSILEMTKDSRFFLIANKKKIMIDLQNNDRKKFDVIFIALHGKPGEDGTIQGMLESLGIPYTGSDTLSSALAMNKIFAAQIYKINGLNTPNFEHIKKEGWKQYRNLALRAVKTKIGFPCIVKPVDQGSAIGVSIVKKENNLPKIIDKIFNEFEWIMAQKFICGEEATCGILATQKDKVVLPPTHILPVLGEFYDYKAKYAKGGSTHICPADFSAEINKALQNLACRAHKALRCRGMSRTDFIVSRRAIKSGHVKVNKSIELTGMETTSPYYTPDIFILETNTIPGMTPTSLLPEAAGKTGINFSEMLDIIIQASI